MRKVVGVSKELHRKLNDLSDELKLPMTVILEAFTDNAEAINWDNIREHYERNKPNWENIRRIVKGYQESDPTLTDQQLSELTGFSLKQVETVTHSAHKRCITYLKKNPKAKIKGVAKACSVSEQFAKRIYNQMYNEAKIPRAERYLHD